MASFLWMRHPVVIVIQFHIGIGLVRKSEGLRDEVITDDIVPPTLAHSGVLDRLVDNIPAVQAPVVAPNNRVNVFPHPMSF